MASRNAPDIHPHPMLTVVLVMRRKPEDLAATVLAYRGHEELLTRSHRMAIDRWLDRRMPGVHDLGAIEVRADRCNGIDMRGCDRVGIVRGGGADLEWDADMQRPFQIVERTSR